MRGHVRKRGGTWCVVVDLGGTKPGRDRQTGEAKLVRNRQWHSGFPTRKAAEDGLGVLLGQIQANTYVPPKRQSVGEWLTTWLDQYARPAVAGTTFERYAAIVTQHLTPRLGGIGLAKLDPLQVDALYAALREQKLSETTIRQVHAVLHRALRVAVKKGRLGRNVCDAVDAPRPAKHTARPLDEGQTVALIEATAGTPLGLPVLLAVYTGMRRGELLALRWRDVDLDGGRLTVRESLEQTTAGGLRFKPPKSGKPRVVALPAGAGAALRKHHAAQAQTFFVLGKRLGEDDLVLALVDGAPWPPDRLSKAFGDFLRRRTLPRIRFHDLRHGHASHLLRKKIPLKVVSERLGHATIAITADLYSHVLDGMDREAADTLDAALRRVEPAAK